jgi:hypothetical protein
MCVNRCIKLCIGGSGFDLHKGDSSATPRDQIHFTGAYTNTLTDDAPAMESQPPGRNALTQMAACFSGLSLHSPFISMARA